METKKLIQVKKGASIRDTMIVIIMFIGGLALFLNFASLNAVEHGVEMDGKFNSTYTNLKAQQNNVTKLVTDLNSAAANLTEAKIGDYAFFGLRGVLSIMQLPLMLVSTASNSWSYVSTIFDTVPSEAKTMILVIMLIIIIFAIIKFVTSRGTEA